MFRCLQKTRYPFAYIPSVKVTEQLEDGTIVEKEESSIRNMPPPENFSLKYLMRAGVPIKEVNGVLFESDNLDLSTLSSPSEIKPAEIKPAEIKPAETTSVENQTTTTTKE